MPTYTLISHPLCPYVQRVAIAFSEKGIAFEFRYVDLDDKPDWFVAQSPLGKTPLLKIDNAILFESAVMCEYLEDTLPPALHPDDPLMRAHHRAWIEFGSAILGDIWGLETARDITEATRKADDLRNKFEWVERYLADGPFFAGAHFHLVDAAFGPVFRYFDVFDELFDFGIFAQVPKVRAWRSALAQRPSVRDAVPDDYRERLLIFLRNKNAYLYQFITSE
jgi:glutathione S-transferase